MTFTSHDLPDVELFGTGYPLEADPIDASLPVRWEETGGADDVVRAEEGFDRVPGDEPTPDAVARGWASSADSPRSAALFVLAGRTLGVSRDGQTGAPLWLDLEQVVGLDALGDPIVRSGDEPLQAVELTMEDGTVVSAGWPLGFCDEVVATLQRLAGRPEVRIDEVDELRSGPPVATDESPEPAAEAPAPVAEPTVATPSGEVSPAVEVSPAATPRPRARGGVPAERVGTLELEDVVYLGGYPGHHKKRRKCTATLGRDGLDVAGPGDLHFRISWDVVRTIEVQNSDEARFRMNAKIHRDASALVVECDQDVTLLLEARDCPTIALRSAIAQLMADLPVVVV